MYLRVPSDLRERIRAEASANGRTLTGEVVFRLRQAYGMQEAPDEKRKPQRDAS